MKLNSIVFAAMMLTSSGMLAAELTGDTTHPENSFFIHGENVGLVFNVSKAKACESLSLELNICDYDDKTVRKCDIPVKTDESGCAEIKVDAPSDKLGFYRVYAKLSDGTTIAKQGTRFAGQITYAIIHDPAKREKFTQNYTFFGMCGGSSKQVEKRFTMNQFLGVSWVGDVTNWRQLEWKHPGQYTALTNIEDFCLRESLKKKGPVKPGEIRNDYGRLQIYNGIPQWDDATMKKYFRMELQARRGRQTSFTSEGKKYFADYCRKIGANVAKQFADHEFHMYSITEEWACPNGFLGTYEDMVEVYRIAYEALHEADPKAVVTGAGFGWWDGFGATLNEGLFKAGFHKYIDAFSHHSYCLFPPEPNGLIKRIRSDNNRVKELCGREIPIFGTEFGYATEERQERENIQMRGLIRSNLIFLGEGFKCNYSFYTSDYACEPGYGVTYNHDADGGWAPKKVSPKPSFPAFTAMTWFIEGARPVSCIDYLGETAWGYAYQTKAGKVTLALWDYGTAPRKIEIPVGRKEIDVADMMGNVRKVKTGNGVLTLTLTEDPQYVIDASPEIWGRNAFKNIRLGNTAFQAVADDESLEISGKIVADKEKFDGELVFSAGEKIAAMKTSVSCNPGEEKDFSFRLPLGGCLPLGTYPYLLQLKKNGITIAATGGNITIASPVEMLGVEPGAEPGKTGIKMTLKECVGRKCGVVIETRVPGHPAGRTTTHYEIAPNEKKEVIVPMNGLDVNALKYSDVEVTVKTDGGIEQKSKHQFNFLFAPYRPDIVIDGEFSDWKGVPEYSFDEKMVTNGKRYFKGRSDTEAAVSVAWNDKHVLFRVRVNDDQFMQKYSDWSTWREDCVQMAFTRSWRYKDTNNFYLDNQHRAQSEIDFALSPKGPHIFRTATFDDKQHPRGEIDVSKCPMKVAKRQLPDGRTELQYEIAVPLSFMNLTKGETGWNIGWAITVNDLDEGKESYSALGAFHLKNPNYFGIITLSK